MNREPGLEGLRPASMQAWQPKTCMISCMRSLKSGISASKMFQAVYISILGKRSGPRSGYFMASLDRKFLLDRLNEAGGESVGVDE